MRHPHLEPVVADDRGPVSSLLGIVRSNDTVVVEASLLQGRVSVA
jgi:hypothetical protein